MGTELMENSTNKTKRVTEDDILELENKGTLHISGEAYNRISNKIKNPSKTINQKLLNLFIK